MKDKMMYIRIEEEKKKLLQDEAKKRGRTLSNYVMSLVDRATRKRSSR